MVIKAQTLSDRIAPAKKMALMPMITALGAIP
jgi:hypothetical protein